MSILRRAFQSRTDARLQRYWPALRLWIIAFYTSRVAAEYLAPFHPLAGTVGGALLGLLIGYQTRARAPRWPVALLIPAVVFPFQSPELALLCGLLAGIVTFVTIFEIRHWSVEIGVFAAALVLFGLTLAPGVQPADGGEFQLVIAEWGVAHPPGYPLYTMLGGVFARLVPIQDFAWRANLFSAVTAALTLAIVARTIRIETGSGWAGILASGTLGSASAFWTTATQASIRPLTALFMALLIAAALHYRRACSSSNARGQQRGLVVFGLAAGFGVTHHVSLFFPGIILAFAMVAARPRLLREVRRWAVVFVAALAGALPWAYLVARGAAGARLAPPDLATWDGFWRHVLASGFAGDMLYYRSPPEVLERLSLVTRVFESQWHASIFVASIVALLLLVWRDRWAGLGLGGAFAIHTFVAATYRAPQTVEYLIPAYVCLACGVGLGIAAIMRHNLLRPAYPVIAAMVVAGIIWSGWPAWISLRAYQQQDLTGTRAMETLQHAPADSVILANWHMVTPLWVVQATTGLRPDVGATYVAPAGSEPILDTWARLIEESVTERRSAVTCSYYPETFRHLQLVFASSGPCWHVTPQALERGHAGQGLAEFDAGRLLTAALPAEAHAGERLSVDLTWELKEEAPYGSLAGYVHLLDASGALVAQSDQPFMAPAVQATARIAQRHTVFLPRTLQAGDYTVTAGLYRPATQETQPGADTTTIIGKIAVVPARLPPVTAHAMRTPLDDRLVFAGYDYDFSVQGRARLYLHWQLRALEAQPDYRIALYSEGSELASAVLNGSVDSGFVTTAHDIPDTTATHAVLIVVERDGISLPVRGAWGLPVQPAIWLPSVRSATRYIMVGEVVVTDYRVTEQSAESIVIELTMRSLVPQQHDMTFKLNCSSLDVSVPPVGGMLPSLKWAWNSVINDAIMMTGTREALAPLTLTFYDSFTSATWPIFDPVLGQAGPALALVP